MLETNEFNDKRYVIAERLCLYWAVKKRWYHNVTPFWFDSDEITDPFPLHALQHVLFASWQKKKSLTDFLTSGNFSSMATFGNTPSTFKITRLTPQVLKYFISLQIVQKLPCLRILSFWGEESKVCVNWLYNFAL